MIAKKVILTITAALALSASPAFASSSKTAKKPAATASDSKSSKDEKKLQGTVVSMTDDTMVVRTGNKDKVFKLDSSTRKSGNIAAGNKVSVNFQDRNHQHVASNIELMPDTK